MSELAEGARLEIVCAAKSGTEGSNPSLSATFHPSRSGEPLTPPTIRVDLWGAIYYSNSGCHTPVPKYTALMCRQMKAFFFITAQGLEA